ncbi:tyrosine-type recombinase/integrase [Xanthomonas euvesicatoria pv. eucalypti]|uniref:tyrosine-type recombinase/integrase n=1 Tax=Xanthomonas euvesicatoria TaxID=456327 RepID=UPI0026E3F84E|nr:tyrosine-type recombinase/integrase [Xanthomonas euvesicatoria]MDO7931545.1 tyrosine-type recombinase/integrase [Xanthomonas euvesicatoria pv. eucalypti]MDO7935728.1 tyrosine-type recombinase/integrase [Xanthomonas euvesicatoria pv. eucalypti]MDO7940072.1 tyrosine-type recombinase/integrase [Xanthomonas euvesicatoria pv. eucalypti]MDO7944575.1 tyrosine-type recombinase/integrase [Xanthomonas euvesicatoria pv. eucalypti]MDO7951977.1 tyrosine-type recombinase/integrase [Xanthomonas euvesicato
MSDELAAVPVPLLVVDGLQPELVAPHAPVPRWPAERAAPPQPPSAFEAIRARLQVWEAKYEKAKRPNTVKALRADWNEFKAWCGRASAWPLPAAPETLLCYLSDQVALGKKAATLTRYVNSIRTLHQAAGLPCPTAHPDWALDWQGVLNRLGDFDRVVPTQATPLTSEHVAGIVDGLGKSLLDLRDAALIRLAADTLCRESELAQLRVEDFKRSTSGWAVRVRRTKTDRHGVSQMGAERHVAEETKTAVDAWCAAAAITTGFLFLPVGRKRNPDPAALSHTRPIRPKEVARIIRSRALRAEVPDAATMSGHSARVGSAVEMIENGSSVQDVQFAGGWQSPRMVLQYAQTALAGQSAMATLRAKQRSRRLASEDS